MDQKQARDVRRMLQECIVASTGYDVMHSVLPGLKGYRFILYRTLAGQPPEQPLEVYYTIKSALREEGYRIADFQIGMRLVLVEVVGRDSSCAEATVRPMIDEPALMNRLFVGGSL